MIKRFRDAYLAFRGFVTMEQVAESLTIRDKANAEANTIAQMLHEQDEQLYLVKQEFGTPRGTARLAQLMDAVEARRIAESKRIASIMIPELEKKYGRDEEQIAEARRIGRRV